MDEAHTLGQGARGARVEGLIARVRAHQIGGAPVPLMLLSAALDERAKLESWAACKRVFASSWTPTARRLAFWRADGMLEWHAELAGGAGRVLGEKALAWPQPIRDGGDGWARVRRLEPAAWENVAHLARQLHEERGGAVLCLCATRRATREVGRALGEKWEPNLGVGGALARCIESIEARHRTLLPLARLLERGVAWHNSALPPEVRDALEEAIADGQIHAVAATSTLAEGVDLPFAQTIVADWLKWDETGQSPLSSALFRNIAGRCGRAGAFTEGDTLVFDNPLGPAQFTAPAVRRKLQHQRFVGAILSEPQSALLAPTQPSAPLRAAIVQSNGLALQANDAAPRKNDRAPEENDLAPKENGLALKENDRAFKENDRAFKENDLAPKENDLALKENDPALKENDLAFKENDAALKENDAAVEENGLAVEASGDGVGAEFTPVSGSRFGLEAGASSARENKVGAARNAVEAALESQLLALMRERPELTASEAARLFYASRFDGDFAARIAEIWADFERDGIVENGVLSARGAAIARTDWSPASAHRLLGALQALPPQRFESALDMARLNAYLWRALGALPEAGGEVERFFRARSRLVARPEDLEGIGRMWLAGLAPETMFAALPRAEKLEGLGVWLERDERPDGRETVAPVWGGEFDKWLDFGRAGLESWTPWIWRTAAILAPLAGPRAAKIKWQLWARRFELGVDSAWAARALQSGAPGTRTTCALVGRHWPFRSSEPARDGLVLAPLREEIGRKRAQVALDEALREAGGAYCFAGRNVLALRDWLWARAGLTK